MDVLGNNLDKSKFWSILSNATSLNCHLVKIVFNARYHFFMESIKRMWNMECGMGMWNMECGKALQRASPNDSQKLQH